MTARNHSIINTHVPVHVYWTAVGKATHTTRRRRVALLALHSSNTRTINVGRDTTNGGHYKRCSWQLRVTRSSIIAQPLHMTRAKGSMTTTRTTGHNGAAHGASWLESWEGDGLASTALQDRKSSRSIATGQRTHDAPRTHAQRSLLFTQRTPECAVVSGVAVNHRSVEERPTGITTRACVRA